MNYRPFDATRDRTDVYRIWEEVGWIDKSEHEKLDRFLESGKVIVSDHQGAVECMVLTTLGDLRYVKEEIPFCCIASVTTGRVARQLGLASHLTTVAVAEAAAEGTVLIGLSMFEQGFYDQLGFGTGSYEHTIAFDPGQLVVRRKARSPLRLTNADWIRVHAARLQRKRLHGSCNLWSSAITRSDMEWSENRFGLGYADGDSGELSHYIWLDGGKGGSGPMSVCWLCYQTHEQFWELLALLHSLSDQLLLVRMTEPPGIQMQDFLKQPLRGRRITANSPFTQQIKASANWQMRLCDLPGALKRTSLSCETLRFNLALTDPIGARLNETSPWQGIGGEYVIELGPQSHAERGRDTSLPLLKASVGAFTRLWLGVRSATGLAISDDLVATSELLEQLDAVLRLPTPAIDWDY